jgi:hypothetical protein
LERTTMRAMPWLRSMFSKTFAASTGLIKLGRPVPLPNLSDDAKASPRDDLESLRTYWASKR